MELHADVLRAAVFDGIRQRLLRDAIEAQRRLRGKRRWDPMRRELDLETVAVIQLVTKARDRRGEPQLLELRRMELMRQLVHRRRQLSDVTQQFLYPGTELAHGLRGLLANEFQRHGQERKPLTRVVEHDARDPPRDRKSV